MPDSIGERHRFGGSTGLSGQGDLTTAPFALAGGNYAVAWNATDNCYVGATARGADGYAYASIANEVLSGGGGKTTYLHSLAPGRYYLDVSTDGCSWRVTLTQR